MQRNDGEEIGFVGLGTMGGPMAFRLMDAGCRLVLHDVRRDALEPLAARGASVVGSPREVASRAQIVFACLPSPAISRDVALGANGIVAGTTVQVYVETSTIGVAAIEAIAADLAAAGVAVVDAPVSGGKLGAETGGLSMMMAGARAATARLDAYAPILAKSVFHVGERPGLGQICKVINNALSITGTAIACEAVVLGVKAGMDAHTLIDVLNASTGRNSATASKFPRHILPRTFGSGAPMEIGAKDIGLYLAEAERLGLPSPVGSSVAQVFRMAVGAGGGLRDITSLITMFEQWAGVEVGGDKNPQGGQR